MLRIVIAVNRRKRVRSENEKRRLLQETKSGESDPSRKNPDNESPSDDESLVDKNQEPDHGIMTENRLHEKEEQFLDRPRNIFLGVEIIRNIITTTEDGLTRNLGSINIAIGIRIAGESSIASRVM